MFYLVLFQHYVIIVFYHHYLVFKEVNGIIHLGFHGNMNYIILLALNDLGGFLRYVWLEIFDKIWKHCMVHK